MTKLLCNFIVLPSILLAFGAAAGFYASRAFFKPEPVIKIKEIEKPIVKYVKVVERDDTEALYACYQSPIKIQYKMIEPETMRVIAGDVCKQTRQDIRLEVSDRAGWKTYAVIGGGALIVGGLCGLAPRR